MTVDLPTSQEGCVCADCGASNPQWASLNRGVIICSECCYVHRNLGRHVSQVRSLSKGMWHPNQLNLVYALYKSGANNIWEYLMIVEAQNGLKTITTKKPVSNDPITPKKETFIRAKYSQHAFTIRPMRDDQSNSLEDFSRQLWSCVRTSRVETSLRLLALGASPNFADQETGNTPLHIAAKEGQALQIELLWLYGADVGQKNAEGHTARDLALLDNHVDVAGRLLELEFEVTDRLSRFLCGRTCDHNDAKQQCQHFLIPDIVGPPVKEELLRHRRLLQASSGIMLERLVQDVYDEVDRRECNAQWTALDDQTRLGLLCHAAIFLPPNPKLTATRNQMRQKLAKFDQRDFSQLAIDVLRELRRRYYGLPLDESRCTAVEEDMRPIGVVNGTGTIPNTDNTMNRRSQHHKVSTNGTHNAEHTSDDLAYDSYLELKERQTEICERLDKITLDHQQMLKSMKTLQSSVEELQMGQTRLRMDFDEQRMERVSSPSYLQHPIRPEVGAVIYDTSSLQKSFQLPANGKNKLVGDRKPLQKSATTTLVGENRFPTTQRPSIPQVEHATSSRIPHKTSTSVTQNIQQSNDNSTASEDAKLSFRLSPLERAQATVQAVIKNAPKTGISATNRGAVQRIDDDIEFSDTLIAETELLTSAIKSLLADLEPASHSTNTVSNAVFHADVINQHIVRILNAIPLALVQPQIQQAMASLETSMRSLNHGCLLRPVNSEEIRQATCDIARAVKQLLLVAVPGNNDKITHEG